MPGWVRGRARVTDGPMSETERALAESIERYHSLFAYSPHAAFSLDLEGRFTDANAVAQEVSGYSLEEFLSMSFADLIRDDEMRVATTAFLGALDRQPQEVETSMSTKDGGRLELNVIVVPVVVYDEVVGVHGLAENITERNAMQRELERTRRAAEEASAAKSLFLANMSHEVRTPLTSVLGATEMLADSDLGPTETRLVDLIHRSGEKLLRLVNDILDVSRLEQGKLDVTVAPFSLPGLVGDVVAWARPLVEREALGFTADVDPAVPVLVTGDAMRITQVLTNLLGNASKFTEHGHVRLQVEAAGRWQDTVEIRFVVEDSGIGISSEQLPSLFESFTQADNSTTRRYGGAGLGLAICQELVTLMGGTLTAHSAPGAGSVFAFTLPLHEQDQG